MPRYNYICLACKAEAETVKGSELDGHEIFEVIFETMHSMNPTVAELAETTECPRCDGNNTEKTLLGVDIGACFVRGNGYLDKRGCHRDMNLHTLVNHDPYAEHRVVGEVDDIKARIKKSGQHDPKPQYFINNGGSQ